MYRQTSAITLSLAVALSAACENQSPSEQPSIDETEQAVWSRDNDGEPIEKDDNSGPSRNVVIRIPSKKVPPGMNDVGCTGVMLTPSLVLTSKFCLSDGKGGATPDIQVGSKQGGFTKRTVDSVIAMPATSPIAGLDTSDLSLIKLKLPTTPAEAYLVPSMRPTLAAPSLPNPQVPAPAGGNRVLPRIEMVGWSPFAIDDQGQTVAPTYAVQNRQFAQLDSAYINYLTGDGIAPFFVREVHAPMRPGTAQLGLHSGDVGSPLYYFDSTASTATRKLIGLASYLGMATTPAQDGTVISERPAPVGIPGTRCELARCDVWTDLTSTAARSFIDNNANTGAGRRWLRFHPRADGLTNYWYGESDVLNASCEPNVNPDDPECDGWKNVNTTLADGDFFKQRDNCPAAFNPDQKDTDDDGQGDVCDNCTNTSDPDCDGRPDPYDNCPTVANSPSFADQDGDGIGDACDKCSDVIDNNGVESQACAASCQNNAILGNNNIGVVVGAYDGQKLSPSTYGSRNCDNHWIFEFNPNNLPSYPVLYLTPMMDHQDYKSAGLEEKDKGQINPANICNSSSMSAELWVRRNSDKGWERLETYATGFHWSNSTCTGPFCFIPKCPDNEFCPANCWQNTSISSSNLDTKIANKGYDKARFIGTLNTLHQYKTNASPATAPMQGWLRDMTPPK